LSVTPICGTAEHCVAIDSTENHDFWMRRALQLACASAELGEVPVGAVVVSVDNSEIGSGANQPVSSNDPTSHAEINALRAAGNASANYRLPGTRIYVTVEPCTMCLGALIHARVDTLIFGTREPKSGAVVSHPLADFDERFNHRLNVVEGILRQECRELMQDFFTRRRKS